MELQKTQSLLTGDISTIAKTFIESGLFPDVKSMAAAFVKIQAGQELGIPPFASMSGIHIIHGKAELGAGIIAGKIKGSNKYDYVVTKQSDNVCEIDFYQGNKKIGTSKFTQEDAKRAGTQNMNKYPANMLFARAISNGAKWYCPDVFQGPVYVHGEISEVEDQEPTIIKPAGKKPITEKQLTSAIKRILDGDLELLQKVSITYTLDEEQEKQIASAAISPLTKLATEKVSNPDMLSSHIDEINGLWSINAIIDRYEQLNTL